MKETRTGGAYQPVGGLMTAGLMLALFIAALDSTVVATALPTISAALGWSGALCLAYDCISCFKHCVHAPMRRPCVSFWLEANVCVWPGSLCCGVCAVRRGSHH